MHSAHWSLALIAVPYSHWPLLAYYALYEVQEPVCSTFIVVLFTRLNIPIVVTYCMTKFELDLTIFYVFFFRVYAK